MSSDLIVAAVDIGGTKIAAGLVTRDGRILAQASAPTTPAEGFDAAVERTASLLESCASQAGARPSAIGIGCTGPVNPLDGTLGEVNLLPGWQGAPLTQALSARLGLPAALENDADAAALAEAAFGAGRGRESFLLVSVGTGIGTGLVLQGRLYRGTGGAHPEAGHMLIEPDGLDCTCGARGCWEAYASGPALETWYNQHKPANDPAWNGRHICVAAEAGQPLAQQAIQREGRYLGIGLANLVTCFCPDVVALAGGLMERFDLFAETVHAVVQANCRMVPFEQVQLVRAGLGDRAGLLGAAQVWWSRAD
jgi:glucokinase